MKLAGKILAIMLFGLTIGVKTSFAQFITLPDPAFANFIATKYPTIVNASKQLDTTKAKTITGWFVCNKKNISNAEGIQYFTSITRVDLTGNNLTKIPDISNITNLSDLIVDSNQIVSLPPLSSLHSLTRLYCRLNQLQTLPSLAGLSNLFNLFINGNQLTTLPDLTGCTSLDHVVCSDNKISSLPDFSTLTSLRRFLISNNKLTSLDLSMLPALQSFHANNNFLSAFPKLNNSGILNEVWVNANFITSLPDISVFPALGDFQVQANSLTFEDLLPLTTHPNFASFIIGPQRKFGTSNTIAAKTGKTFTIQEKIDSSVTNNIYSLYKNGNLMLSSSTPVFSFVAASISDTGSYVIRVNNSDPSLVGIQLISQTKKVIVTDCFNGASTQVDYPKYKCSGSVNVSINEMTITGDAPFHYTLTNITSGEIINSASPIIPVEHEGIYDFEIIDNSGCTYLLQSKIDIQKNKDCDVVLYPDIPGDGSSFYISEKGTAKIYDRNGRLVRKLQAPAEWDGRDESGELLATGVYIIFIHDSKIQISLIRSK